MDIINWECVRALPRWKATHQPFLEAPDVMALEPLGEGNLILSGQCAERSEKTRLRKASDAMLNKRRGLRGCTWLIPMVLRSDPCEHSSESRGLVPLLDLARGEW